ncbi:MAG: S4 domain-containing protein, partial [Pseudomonadota bacterium]|nr:S4 domain-containing protein [Pseudomonadota bacterium]
MPGTTSTGHFVVRLDQWLWAARLFKTRSLARAAIESGKVELAAQRVKPARPVRVDDALRVTRGEETFELVVA